MTYAASQVGYWIGQANDTSTASHPTGWTSGQRWSETAGEWQTMYDTEYAGARDNSAGQPGKPSGNQHPTGWVAGQLWSTTATQWNTMWGTEWTNGRDNSAGQPGKPSGNQHPTGWVANQAWSTTATQWNTMWGTEWNNARDPQGYTYSYPGQAANAVYWSQSAQYWRGQADYYWGPSRVWNNGSTWEQLYNNYVAYYNDMVTQRDTWISRANQAWGPSRVWNSGESWEAAYNRVLPPALSAFQANFDNQLHYADSVYQVSLGGPSGSSTYFDWSAGNSVKVKRTGYYSLQARVKAQYATVLDIRRNGSSIFGESWTDGGDGAAYTCLPLNYQTSWVQLNANDVLSVWERSRVGSYSGTPSFFEVVFVPTTTYPS